VGAHPALRRAAVCIAEHVPAIRRLEDCPDLLRVRRIDDNIPALAAGSGWGCGICVCPGIDLWIGRVAVQPARPTVERAPAAQIVEGYDHMVRISWIDRDLMHTRVVHTSRLPAGRGRSGMQRAKAAAGVER